MEGELALQGRRAAHRGFGAGETPGGGSSFLSHFFFSLISFFEWLFSSQYGLSPIVIC